MENSEMKSAENMSPNDGKIENKVESQLNFHFSCKFKSTSRSNSKDECKVDIKSELEPELELEMEPETEGTRFDVLDMVEEPMYKLVDYYSSDGDVAEAMKFKQDSSGSGYSEDGKQVIAGSSANAAANQIVCDDIEIEQVFETNEGNSSDRKECFVAERPVFAASHPLPEGWKEVYHESGATIYVNLETNVCSLSRPYFLGPNSIKNHVLVASAVPCFSSHLGKRSNVRDNVNGTTTDGNAAAVTDGGANSVDTVGNGTVSHNAGNTTIQDDFIDSTISGVSSDSTVADTYENDIVAAANTASNTVITGIPFNITDATIDNTTICATTKNANADDDVTIADAARTSCVTASDGITAADAAQAASEKSSRAQEKELVEYCKRLFKFKTIKYLKFRSWDVRRTYLRTLRNERNRRKGPFSGNQFMTLPIKLKDEEGNVVSTKKWMINPRGRSYVAILHEYLQQSQKTQPDYKFSEVDNARTPYAATVVVNGTEYSSGVGMSKKEAKFEAAKATLQVLLPKMMKHVLNVGSNKKSGGKKFEDCSEGGGGGDGGGAVGGGGGGGGGGGVGGEDDEGENVASVFDDIEITDSRISELSTQTTELKPYELLLNCLQKKGSGGGGGGGTGGGEHSMAELKFDFQDESEECTMSVAEHKVTMKCANKREGKQLAAQALLQALHPHINNWGSLLRLYGHETAAQYRQVSEEDREVEELKCKPPNVALLQQLKRRMTPLRGDGGQSSSSL